MCLCHTITTTISRSLEFQKVAANSPLWGIHHALLCTVSSLCWDFSPEPPFGYLNWRSGHSCGTVPCSVLRMKSSHPKRTQLLKVVFYLKVLHGCRGLRVVYSSLAFPLKPLQTMPCPLPFPLTLPLQQDAQEDWRHKRERSRVEIRTSYWKQQWQKKINGNSNNINDKIVQGRGVVVRGSLTGKRSPLHNVEPDSTQPQPSATKCQGALPLLPENDARWHRIPSGSWTCPTPGYCKN